MTSPSGASGALAGTIVQGYRFGAEIGHGPRARVLEGYQIRLRRPVALKLLHPRLAGVPGSRAAFLEAARDAAGLIHPNVVPIMDVVDEGPHAFAVMPHRDAPTLARLQAGGNPLPFQEVCQLALQIIDVLRTLHLTGRWHGNLCPENIFWEDDGRYCLADFFLCPPTAAPPGADPSLVSRLAYVAPRIRLGGEGGAACDLFSLGAILSTACCGFPPDSPNPLKRERLARAPRDFLSILETLSRAEAAGSAAHIDEIASRMRDIQREAASSGGGMAVPARADLPMISRRNYRRLPVDFPARLESVSDETRKRAAAAVSRLRDMSENGVFVATDQPLPPGTLVELDFNLPGGEAIHSLGVVRWVALPPRESGMGVQFVEVATGQKMSLADYMAGRLSDEAAHTLTATPARRTLLGLLPELWGSGHSPADLAEWLGLDQMAADGESLDRLLSAFVEYGLARVKTADTGQRIVFTMPTSPAFAEAIARLGGWSDEMIRQSGHLAGRSALPGYSGRQPEKEDSTRELTQDIIQATQPLSPPGASGS